MKFLSLDIENFYAIEKASVSLADRGLIVIQGENQDDASATSNGAGKSSIGDALSWSLYGITARGEDGDRVVNTAAGKNTRVAVRFVDDGSTYEIARHRKHKTGKNSVTLTRLDAVGLFEEDLTLGTDKLTQARINKLLGASYEVFVASVYAGQEQMPDLPSMTDKNLKTLIEEASGSTVLNEAYAVATVRYGEAKKVYIEANNQFARANLVAENYQENIHDSERSHADFEERRRTAAEELDLRLKEKVAAQGRLLSEIDRLPAIEDLDVAIKACDSKIAGVSEQNRELALFDRKIAGATGARKALIDSATAKKAEYERIAKEIAQIASEIGTPCPECGRPLTASEVEPRKKAAVGRQLSVLNEIKTIRAQIDAHTESLKKLTDERDTFSASMIDVSAEITVRANLTKERDEVQRLVNQHKFVTHEAEELKKQIERNSSAPNPLTAHIEKQRELLDTAKATLMEAGKRVEEAETDLDIWNSVVAVFSTSGVRARILDEVTPFLNAQTAKYLGVLSDGNISATWSTLVPTAKGELREKFAIEVANDIGGETFKAISGGEKRKVRISTALALQDLVARRATKPIDLFIGDEIDDALDTAGLERLMSVLQEKAKERGTVLVISHNDLKDWISNQILVTRKDKKATIKEITV